MLKFLFDSSPFILSTGLSLGLLYTNIPIKVLQQLNSVVFLILIFGSARYFKVKPGNSISSVEKYFYTLICSFFLQLLVLSTGGFFSPFLILIHIFTIGASFILNFRSSIVFIILSVFMLLSSIYLNVQMKQLFIEDPASILLYLISFIVIVPLAHMITGTYYLKDILYKKISDFLKISIEREGSIMKGLNEVVIITDINLKIVSVNEAAEKILSIYNNNVFNHNLLDEVEILDSEDKKISREALSIESILSDKTSRIIDDLYIKLRNLPKKTKASIQIRPVIDSANKVSQFVFVISNANVSNDSSHKDIEQTHVRSKLLFDEIKKQIIPSSYPQLAGKIELLSRVDEDYLIAVELQDHLIKPESDYIDIAEIIKSTLDKEKEFAQTFDNFISLEILTDKVSEDYYQKLIASKSKAAASAISPYAASIDKKMFAILIKKIIDLIILVSGDKNMIYATLKNTENKNIEFNIQTKTSIPIENTDDLLYPYYGLLGIKTKLSFGSGLEGYISKIIAGELNIPIEARFNQFNNQLIITLKISKAPILI